jgi:predicted ATPase
VARPDPVLTRQVRDAIAHLHDLPYLQTHPLAGRLGGGRGLQRALTEVVEELSGRPRDDARGGRIGPLLHLRYVEALEPAAVWRRLGVGRSEYYQAHTRGLSALTDLLRVRLSSAGTAEPKRAESRPATAPSSRLPTPISRFVGRRAEMEQVRARLSSALLLTLTGIGGVGKTRLAVEAARASATPWRDGVWFVDLAPIAEPARLPAAVLAALEGAGTTGQAPGDALIEHLRPRQALVVLDNCEHLVAGVARLTARILRECPGLVILATSREPLGVDGEALLPVPPLDPSDAAMLFADRVKLVRPDLRLQGREEVVESICRRLEGIPLAIELAAARLVALSLDELAVRLDDRLRLLTRGRRGEVARHQTMRAALDWSFDLLAEPERVLLRRLSVFVGAFDADAAERVCADERLDAADVFDVLTELVRKSLVLAANHGATTRYTLLETVREYALEQLADADEAETVRAHHARYFRELASAIAPILTSELQTAARDRLHDEHDNLRAALDFALATGDLPTSLPLATSLARLPDLRQPVGEARALIERLLGLVDAAATADVTAEARLDALFVAWRLAYLQGDYAAASGWAAQLLAAGRASGDPVAAARALRAMGNTALRERRFEQARAYYADAAEVARAGGAAREEAAAIYNLGRVALGEGRLDDARALVSDAVARHRRIGDVMYVNIGLRTLATVAVEQGDADGADRYARECMAAALEVGGLAATVRALRAAAGPAGLRGQHRRVLTLYAASEAFREGLPEELARGNERRLEPIVAAARAALGPEAETVEAAARALDAPSAVAYALGGEV